MQCVAPRTLDISEQDATDLVEVRARAARAFGAGRGELGAVVAADLVLGLVGRDEKRLVVAHRSHKSSMTRCGSG